MSGWTSSSFLYQPPISSPHPVMGPRARFSRLELQHIAIAFVVLTADLVLILLRDAYYPGIPRADLISAAFGAAVAAPLAAATGFVAHEMAHKFSAQHRGLRAEFRMSPQGLLMSFIFSALLGFLFATPGATMIGGRGTMEEAGITSLAGPGTNLAEAAGFAGIAILLARFHEWFWAPLIAYVAFINVIFAAFNLLPLGPLDGKKVLAWNKGIWVLALAGAVAMGVFAYLYLFPWTTGPG
ncbi:MAG: hypothetical protein KGI98_05885 [Euryarchaeota archaeon]|nr:hypothetical protein [Euryarchaeota archaeon]